MSDEQPFFMHVSLSGFRAIEARQGDKRSWEEMALFLENVDELGVDGALEKAGEVRGRTWPRATNKPKQTRKKKTGKPPASDREAPGED